MENIQRRTTRSLIQRHLKKLKASVDQQVSQEKAADTGRLAGRMMADTVRILAGKPTTIGQGQGYVVDDVWVELSPNGNFSITRKRFSDGIRMTSEQFDACIDSIRTRTNHDPVDVNKPPEEIVRSYLQKYLAEARSRLPIFKGA